VTTLTSVEDVFVKVFGFVIVASVSGFGELAQSAVLAGTSFAVVILTFFAVREVVTVVVTTSPAFNAVVAQADEVVVEVVVRARDVVIDGAFGWLVTDDDRFVLYTGFLNVSVVSVVTLFEAHVVLRSFSNEFFPRSIGFITTFKHVVGSVAEKTIISVGFHDVVAVFVLDRKPTINRLASIFVTVTRSARQALIVNFDPIRTVFQSS
jgi:hypothetical protein